MAKASAINGLTAAVTAWTSSSFRSVGVASGLGAADFTARTAIVVLLSPGVEPASLHLVSCKPVDHSGRPPCRAWRVSSKALSLAGDEHLCQRGFATVADRVVSSTPSAV